MSEFSGLYNMQEKKIGRGEDSDPIFIHQDDVTVLGVFDGMGGAGSVESDSDFTTQEGQYMTKAYIGSRIIRNAIYDFIIKNPDKVKEPNFEQIIKEIIQERFKIEKEKYPSINKTGLKSTLIKEYPTTLAISCIIQTSNNFIIDSYWAGDSRNYFLNNQGLFQISSDDLKGNLDPLQNLREDAPMSNCIQADGPFKIRHNRIEIPLNQKFVVFSATDGCFGYFQSPMDFYQVLIDTLNKSKNVENWNEKLTKAFSCVTADDFSFSLATIGYKNFKDIQKDLINNDSSLKKYFKLRRKYEEKIKNLKKLELEVSSMNNQLVSYIDELWPHYKKSYLKLVKNYEER